MATTDFARMAKETGHTSLKDMNMTQDELAKIEAAFQKPEFVDMFREYVKEISDPKAREENDLYIRQLEAEGRVEEVYGKGVQLVLPEAAFVIKTVSLNSKEKVFINVCTSDKVEAMSMTQEKTPDGRIGTSIKIPMTYSKEAKKGTDRHGSPCSVWDVVLHPGCISAAGARPALLSTMSEMAIEKLEESGLKLSRHFKHPKMKYKATPGHDKPRAMAIRAATSTHHGQPDVAKQTSPNPSASSSTSATMDKAASRSKFAFPATVTSARESKQAAILTPEFRLIHRGVMDLAEAWGDVGRNLHYNTCLPKDLLLRVSLPGVMSASCIQLDMAEKEVKLAVEGKYALRTSLPYKVDEAKVKAKFDKQKEQLELTMPVLPPPLIPMEGTESSQPKPTAMPSTSAHQETPVHTKQPTPVVHTTLPSSSTPAQPASNFEQPPAAEPIAVSSSSAPPSMTQQPPKPDTIQSSGPAGGQPSEASSTTVHSGGSASVPSTASTVVDSVQAQPAAGPGEVPSSASSFEQDGKQLTENERKWMALHTSKAADVDTEPAAGDAPTDNSEAGTTTDLASIRDVQSSKPAGDAADAQPPAAKGAVACAKTYALKPRVTPAIVEELD